MRTRPLQLALLLPLITLACRAADEQPGSAGERLESSLKTTRELFKNAVSDLRFSADDKYLFPRESHVSAYFQTRSWEASSALPFHELKTPSSWPTATHASQLRALLTDKEPEFRALAASALGVLHEPEDVPRIAALLNDPQPAAPQLERALMSIMPVRLHKDPQADIVDCSLWWQQRTVADYVREALRQMTGVTFTADSFPAWWAKNKDAPERLWYWQTRFERKMAHAEQQARRAPEITGDARSLRGVDTRAADAQVHVTAYLRELHQRCAKAQQEIAAELARLPAETEAKIRLCVAQQGGSELVDSSEKVFFVGPPKLRLRSERLLELLTGQNLWPDVDWAQGNYNRLVVRLSLAAETLFKPEHVEKLIAVHARPAYGLWWDGRATLSIAISRLLPNAPATKLDDPTTREGWLRHCLRTEPELFTRAQIAAELVGVGLPANWEFLKERVFAEQEKNAIPDVRMSVLQTLGKPPLTQARRTALVDLLLDQRFEALWTQSNQRMGCDLYRSYAAQSLNAHAGKELLTYDDQQALQDPARAAKTLEIVQQKVRSLARP